MITYKCRDCMNQWEVDRLEVEQDNTTVCPACGSHETQRVWTATIIIPDKMRAV
jgi:putative FmdB family regulatory protein